MLSLLCDCDLIQRAEQSAAQLEAVLGRVTGTHGDRFAMTVDGHRHTKRVEAGEHLQRLMGDMLDRTPPGTAGAVTEIGQPAGLTVTGQAITTIEDEIRLAVPDAHIEVTYPALDWKRSEPSSIVTRLERQVQRLPDTLATTRAEAATARTEGARAEARTEGARAEARIGTPWDRSGELAALRRRRQEINEQLAVVASPEPDASVGAVPEPAPPPGGPIAQARARLGSVHAPRPDADGIWVRFPGRVAACAADLVLELGVCDVTGWWGAEARGPLKGVSPPRRSYGCAHLCWPHLVELRGPIR